MTGLAYSPCLRYGDIYKFMTVEYRRMKKMRIAIVIDDNKSTAGHFGGNTFVFIARDVKNIDGAIAL